MRRTISSLLAFLHRGLRGTVLSDTTYSLPTKESTEYEGGDNVPGFLPRAEQTSRVVAYNEMTSVSLQGGGCCGKHRYLQVSAEYVCGK